MLAFKKNLLYSLDNSEMVQAVTLAFCSIQYRFIVVDICGKFGMSSSPQSPDIGQNSDRGYFDFRIFGQSLIKENCHNSRTSDDIDMKPGPVTTLDKRNKTMSLPFLQSMANLEQSGSRIPDAQSVKLMFSLIVTFHLTRTENRTKKLLTQLSHYCFE